MLRRLLPRSLLARNILLLVALVAITQACSLTVLMHYVQRPRIERAATVFADYVRTLDRVGLLAEVAGRISATHTNIEHVRVDTEGDASALSFRLKVRDRRQLAAVVRSIRTIPGVVRVARSAG